MRNRRIPLDSEEISKQIGEFLKTCGEPVLIEAGERAIPLEKGKFTLENARGRCVLQAWGEQGNVIRRITGVKSAGRGRLDLIARGFGGEESAITLVDQARRGAKFAADANHRRYDVIFRRLLEREFADWKIRRLSSAADLEHSLSPLFTRAALGQGQHAWAVIGGGESLSSGQCDEILTAGLIWFDWLRRHRERSVWRGLKIFLPAGKEHATAHRLAYLNRERLAAELYRVGSDGLATRVEPENFGNLRSELLPCLPTSEPQEPVAGWIREILGDVEVDVIPCADGLRSLRVRGLEFARAGRGVMTYGLEESKPVTEGEFPRVLALARELSRMRSPNAADTVNPLYRRYPERWLESQIRRFLSAIDGTLLRRPIYQQVPAVAGGDRAVVDLLACDASGRLAVIEIKVSEDLHMPLQALDYWMRVKWHLLRGEFSERGYFHGVEVSREAPRLILVAPGLAFHPTTETLLSCFSPEVEVDRIGVGADWRRKLTVAFRVKGAGRLA